MTRYLRSATLVLMLMTGCECTVSPLVGDAGIDAGVEQVDGGAICDNDALATGCRFGRCTLSTASRPLPNQAVARVVEEPIPEALSSDAVSAILCVLQLPEGITTTDLTLAITLDDPAAAGATLFMWNGPTNSSRALPSHPLDHNVTGLVTSSGSYGVTLSPPDWFVAGYLGVPALGSATDAELLRNLSSYAFGAAFFDGQHLFVGNGPRLLIYDGLPDGPLARPQVVLGQVDLDHELGNTTSALFGTASVNSVWSDGVRLVVGTGNRVLIWRTIPTRNLTPADLVLGQPDFNSNGSNTGGVSASSFGSVVALDSDGTRLVVADAINHRLLGWRTFPTAVAQPADLVVGQPDFLSSAGYGGAFPLYLPSGVALDGAGLFVAGLGGPALAHSPTSVDNPASDFSVFGWQFAGGEPGSQLNRPAGVTRSPGGNVAVRDVTLRRVLVTNPAPSGPQTAAFVLGQPDEGRVVGANWISGTSSFNPSRISGSTIGDTRSLGHGGPTLLIPDERRLMLFDTFPTFNFEPASRVLGQAGPAINETSDYRTISASTLASPADVAFNGTTLAVADRGNNRVLLYDANTLTALAPAARVILGQPNATSFLANGGRWSADARSLSGPGSVALDGTHLIVADTENHRVLIWSTVPTASGAPADLVLGQADFTGTRPNRGRGDAAPADGFSDVAADGLFYPSGLASDGTHLFVSDRLNNRVLVWDTFPTQSDTPPSRVLGQPSFSSRPAHGGTGVFNVTADGFNLPTGLALSGTTLYVADTENNRVVRYANVFTAPAPDAFIGQSGATVSNPNYRFSGGVFAGNPESPPTTETSVLRPRAVAVAQGRLYIAEADSNRVHVLDEATQASLAVLGQRSVTGAAPNLEGISASALAEPLGLASDGTRLWVADSRNHRVPGFPIAATTTTGASPTMLVGQPSFLAVGFNGTSTAAEGSTAAPRGLSLGGTTLYVADTNNHRVIAFDVRDPPAPTRILGQPSDTLALPNAGGPVSARTLLAPRGVAASDNLLAVADTGNHRTLIFDPTSTSPDARLVLGQASVTGNQPNRGGAASLATLSAPGAVCTDGLSLFVVDTGNHRVLGWRTLPTMNGGPADVVLGQADGTGVLGNRGGEPTGATLSLPAGCLVERGRLFVADTGNNRVLRFDSPFLASGAVADAVLGQPDLTERRPAATLDDRAALAGPVGLGTDGTNLYVAERDLSRVVEYGPAFFTGTSILATRLLSSIGLSRVQQVFGGIAARRESLFRTRIYLSDSNASRIGELESVSRLQP